MKGGLDRFLQSTGLTLGSKVLTIFANLVSSVVIARGLGAEGKGLYALAVLLAGLITELSNLGITGSTAYYAARAERNEGRLFGSGILMSLILGSVGTILGGAAMYGLRDTVFQGVSSVDLGLALTLPILMILSLHLKGMFLAYERFGWFNGIDLFRVGAFAAILGILFAFSWLHVTSAILGLVFSRILSTGLALWAALSNYEVSISLAGSNLVERLAYGVTIHLNNMANFLNYRIDIYIVSALMSPAAVGWYALASELAEQLWVLSRSAGHVLFPSSVKSSADGTGFRLTPVVLRLAFTLTLAAATIVAALARPIVELVYTDAFLQSVQPLLLLLPGVVFMSISFVLSNDLNGRGLPKIPAIIGFVGVAMNIALNLLTIPIWGIAGAALASSISYTSMATFLLLSYGRVSQRGVWEIIRPNHEDIEAWSLIFNQIGSIFRGDKRSP